MEAEADEDLGRTKTRYLFKEFIKGIKWPKLERDINRIKDKHSKDDLTESESIQTTLNNQQQIRK